MNTGGMWVWIRLQGNQEHKGGFAVQLPSNLDVGLQLKTSSTHNGYLSQFVNSLKTIYFFPHISCQDSSSAQGAHAKSVLVDQESERNAEYKQPKSIS